jgi:hypothetical protein
MNKADFEHRLLLYGSGFDRWPPDEAQAAQRLVNQDPSAKALLDEAEALGLALTKAVAPDAVESALTEQVLSHIPRRPWWHAFTRVPNWRVASAGAVVTGVAVAGFAAGVFIAGLSSLASDAVLMSMAGADAGAWLLQ